MPLTTISSLASAIATCTRHSVARFAANLQVHDCILLRPRLFPCHLAVHTWPKWVRFAPGENNRHVHQGIPPSAGVSNV